MLAKRIIASVLVKGRTAYKGKAFVSDRSIGSAIAVVRVHAKRSIDELVILDVTATREGRGPDLELIKEITSEVFIPVTVGGGIRTLEHIDRALRNGADKVAIGRGIRDCPGLLTDASRKFGAQALVAIMDVKGNEVVGTNCFGQPLGWPPYIARSLWMMGAGELLLQSVERDGTLQGFDLDMVRMVSAEVPIPVIASGGCGTPEHMLEAFKAGADACASGAMFAFTDETPKGVARYLKSNGLEVRL